jgi:hypothetical protein
MLQGEKYLLLLQNQPSAANVWGDGWACLFIHGDQEIRNTECLKKSFTT